MRVLIIGKGIVGDATGYALTRRGHEVDFHDPPKGIVCSTDGVDCVLICVPTPMHPDGYNCRAAVYRTADWLEDEGFGGPVGIRSTCIPGTCADIAATSRSEWFAWPEFLQVARAREMADDPPYIVFGGPLDLGCELMGVRYDDQRVLWCEPTEAEFIKYATNCLLASAVGVANELAAWAQTLGLDYNALVPRAAAMDTTLPKNVRVNPPPNAGFGGACLPKDLAAAIYHAAQAGVSMPVLEALDRENRKRRHYAGEYKGTDRLPGIGHAANGADAPCV